MVRPRKIKTVNFKPQVTYFKPKAVPISMLEEVEITIDELETLRLANLEGLNQADAAEKMNIHQSTFQRTLTRAREKTTDALVSGKAIKINGGEYKMPRRDGTGPIGINPLGGNGQETQGRGQRGPRNTSPRGRMGGPLAAGLGGTCTCPKCGNEIPHVRGQPCNQIKCQKCETLMTRSD